MDLTKINDLIIKNLREIPGIEEFVENNNDLKCIADFTAGRWEKIGIINRIKPDSNLFKFAPRIDFISEKAEIPRRDVISMFIRQPTLFSIKPKNVLRNAADFCKEFEIEKAEYFSVALNFPGLLLYPIDLIKTKESQLVKEYGDKGLTGKKLREFIIRSPSLLAYSHDHIKQNVDLFLKMPNLGIVESKTDMQMLSLIFNNPRATLQCSRNFVVLRIIWGNLIKNSDEKKPCSWNKIIRKSRESTEEEVIAMLQDNNPKRLSKIIQMNYIRCRAQAII